MDISLTSIKKMVIDILHRYHFILFIITIAGSLVIVIFLLNNIIVTSSSSNGYTSPSDSASFDQSTIDRIKQLKTSAENDGQLAPTQGRTNPFVE